MWNKYKSSAGLRQKNDLDEALEELKTASQLAPKQPRIYFALGQILADRGDLAPAAENLQRAGELDPANPEYHYNLGLALRLKGDMEAAGAQFREALKLDPSLALAHRSLGLVLREAGDFPAATNELRLAVAGLPNEAEGYQLLGTVLLKMNDLPGAIDSFRKAISLNPDLGDAHATLAQALQRAGQLEDAKKELTELKRIDTAKTKAGRAMILVETASGDMKKSDFSTAIGALQEAVSLSPDFAEAYYQLGLALLQADKTSKPTSTTNASTSAKKDTLAQAEAAFQHVLQLDPNNALASFQFGQLLKARGETRRRLRS